MIETIQDKWSAMNRREQQMVAGATVFAALALLWWVMIEPALEGRARLVKDLPALRAQVAEVAGIAQQMTKQPAPVPTAELAPGVQAAVDASGMNGKVTSNASGSVSARFEKVVYSTAAGWAQRSARELGARLDAVSVQSLAPAAGGDAGSGRVTVEFVFAR
jgi:general secretion pathway protein M